MVALPSVTAAGAKPTKLSHDADEVKTVADATAGGPAVLEPKFDGWRILFVVGDDGVARPYTRTGNCLAGAWPCVEDALSALPAGTILDGEAVAFEQTPHGDYVQKWGAVQSILGSSPAKAALKSGALTYVLFDIIAHAGIDARSLPFEKRRKLLEQLDSSRGWGAQITLSPQFDATQGNHDALVEAGYEGSVVKRLSAPYKSGARGAGQFKIKPQATAEAIVVGFKPGTPGSAFDGLVGAIEFAQHDADGNLVPRGRCSGMDFDERVAISADPDAYLGRVFEFAYFEVMPPSAKNPHGGYRSPQWKRWRPDKPADAVTFA